MKPLRPHPNRREFIATTALFTGGALAASAAAAPGKLKVGFLGTGHSHFREKYKVVAESSELGCHLIDAVVRLLGKPMRITPHLQHAASLVDTLADNTVAVFEFARALAIVTSAPLQPNAGAQRCFEVLGTNGTARVQPLEPPALTVDLAKAAGPYAAGLQEVKVPPYRRYVDEFAALAVAIREDKALPVSAEMELDVQESVLRACEML